MGKSGVICNGVSSLSFLLNIPLPDGPHVLILFFAHRVSEKVNKHSQQKNTLDEAHPPPYRWELSKELDENNMLSRSRFDTTNQQTVALWDIFLTATKRHPKKTRPKEGAWWPREATELTL